MGVKRVPSFLLRQDSTPSNSKHHIICLYKQERRHEVGPTVCPRGRMLTCCFRTRVTHKAQHIPGRLNVVAGKVSRKGQIIQKEWFLLPEVFQMICTMWYQPQMNLFATRINDKLPQFVSPDFEAMGGSGPYAFPPVAILGKAVVKLWFWDLAAMLSQIQLCLPNFADSTLQSDSTQESIKPKSSCLARRASAIKEQGFSEAVAA